jgi:hypothetical protein
MSEQLTEGVSHQHGQPMDNVIRVLGLEDNESGRVDRSLRRPQDWRIARTDTFRQHVINFLDSMR